MKRIKFDTGVQSFAIGGGVLRFNPADPNLYARFAQVQQKLTDLEQELAVPDGDPVAVMAQADRKLKELLGWVFGPGNDFDAVASGVSLLAVTPEGKSLAQQLLDALEPVLLEGAQQYARTLAAQRMGKIQ